MKSKKLSRLGIAMISVGLLGGVQVAAQNTVHADDAVPVNTANATTVQPSVDPNIFKEDNERVPSEDVIVGGYVDSNSESIHIAPPPAKKFDDDYLREHEKEEAAKAEEARREKESIDELHNLINNYHNDNENNYSSVNETPQPSNNAATTENSNSTSQPKQPVDNVAKSTMDSSTEKPTISNMQSGNQIDKTDKSESVAKKAIIYSAVDERLGFRIGELHVIDVKPSESYTISAPKVPGYKFISRTEVTNSEISKEESITVKYDDINKVALREYGDYEAWLYFYYVKDESYITNTDKSISVQLNSDDAKVIKSIKTEIVTDKDVLAKLSESIKPNNVSLYDIKVLDSEGKVVNITSEATVTLPVDNTRKVDKVIYFLPQTGAIEELPFTLNDGYVSFKVTHFSNYGVVYEPKKEGEQPVSPTPKEETPKANTPTSQPSNGENQSVNYTVQLVDEDSKVIRSSVESGVEGTGTRISVPQLNGYLFKGYETPTGSSFVGKDTEVSFQIQKDAVIKLHYKVIPPINEIISPEKRAEYQTVYDEFHKTILEAYDVYKKELGVDNITHDRLDSFTKDLSAIHGELVLNKDALDTPVGTVLSDDYFINGLGWTTEYWNYRIESLKTDTQTLKTALNNIAASKPTDKTSKDSPSNINSDNSNSSNTSQPETPSDNPKETQPVVPAVPNQPESKTPETPSNKPKETQPVVPVVPSQPESKTPETPSDKSKPKTDRVDNVGQNDKKMPESVVDNKTTPPLTKPFEKRKTQESHKQDSISNKVAKKEDFFSQSTDKTENAHPTDVMSRLSNGQIVEIKSPSHTMTSTTSLPNTGVAKTNFSLIGFILSLLGLSGVFYKGRHVYRK